MEVGNWGLFAASMNGSVYFGPAAAGDRLPGTFRARGKNSTEPSNVYIVHDFVVSRRGGPLAQSLDDYFSGQPTPG